MDDDVTGQLPRQMGVWIIAFSPYTAICVSHSHFGIVAAGVNMCRSCCIAEQEHLAANTNWRHSAKCGGCAHTKAKWSEEIIYTIGMGCACAVVQVQWQQTCVWGRENQNCFGFEFVFVLRINVCNSCETDWAATPPALEPPTPDEWEVGSGETSRGGSVLKLVAGACIREPCSLFVHLNDQMLCALLGTQPKRTCHTVDKNVFGWQPMTNMTMIHRSNDGKYVSQFYQRNEQNNSVSQFILQGRISSRYDSNLSCSLSHCHDAAHIVTLAACRYNPTNLLSRHWCRRCSRLRAATVATFQVRQKRSAP